MEFNDMMSGLRSNLGDAADKMKQHGTSWGKAAMNAFRGSAVPAAEVAGAAEPVAAAAGGAAPPTPPVPPTPPGSTPPAGGLPGRPGTSFDAGSAGRIDMDAANKATQTKMPNLVKPITTIDPVEGARVNADGSINENAKVPTKGLRFSGKLPGALAIGAEAMNPNVQAAVNPNSDLSVTDRLKQASRSALRVGGGILGGAGGAAVGGPAALITGAAGGYAGYKAGDTVADMLLGPEPKAPVELAKAPVSAGGATPPPPEVPAAGTIPSSQGPQTPQQLIDGTAVPAPGNGAFQRKGGVAQGLRSKSFDGLGAMPSDATPEQAAEWLKKTNVINMQRAATQGQGGGGYVDVAGQGDELTPLRRLAAIGANARPGHSGTGSIAALGAYGALDRMKSNAANLNLRQQQIQATNNLTAMTRNHEWARQERQDKLEQSNKDREFNNTVGKQNMTEFDNEIRQNAQSKVGKQDLSEGKDAYENRIQQQIADDAKVAKYTASAGKQDIHNMSPLQRQGLHQAMRSRDNVIKNRDSGLMAYFGNNQIDSNNAYSYVAKSIEPATRAGESWIIHTANGNKIALKNMVGGKFNPVGTNSPIDADMMAQITPLIEEYNAKKGTKAK